MGHFETDKIVSLWCIIQTPQSCSLRGLVILEPHVYCLISIVIITTLPPSLLYTKVLKQVNYTVELHDTQVHLSIVVVGWIQTSNPSLTFNDQLVPLKIDVPCNTSSTVCVCFLRHHIMSSNPGNWYVSLLLYSRNKKRRQWLANHSVR